MSQQPTREVVITEVYKIVLSVLEKSFKDLDDQTKKDLTANCLATIAIEIAKAQKPYKLTAVIREAMEKWINSDGEDSVTPE